MAVSRISLPLKKCVENKNQCKMIQGALLLWNVFAFWGGGLEKQEVFSLGILGKEDS